VRAGHRIGDNGPVGVSVHLPVASTRLSRTIRGDGRAKIFGAVVLAAAVASSARAVTGWPPFLPPRETLSPDVASSIERVWTAPTLTRWVEGSPAHVPFDVYRRFVDSPEVTAAAARHLALAQYEVRMIDEQLYEADDHRGARGFYRVLVREPGRRVILSSGWHTSTLLGTIRGQALTVLTFQSAGWVTTQRLAAYILIENRIAAFLARALIPIFGGLADRKLAESFQVTAQVAEWAVSKPVEFCEWLASGPVLRADSSPVAESVEECRLADVVRPDSSADNPARATSRVRGGGAAAPSLQPSR
jgi:hypothetical protein